MTKNKCFSNFIEIMFVFIIIRHTRLLCIVYFAPVIWIRYTLQLKSEDIKIILLKFNKFISKNIEVLSSILTLAINYVNILTP